MFEKHTTVATRLEQYRELRTSKLSKSKILEHFGEIKPRSRYIDYWTPKSWPKPFEILEHGYFCTTGISILLYQLLGHLDYLNPYETEWKVISNSMNGFDGAVFVHNENMYNLDTSKPVPIDIAKDYYVELTTFKNLYIPII
jgi:hypothetical protein